MSRNVSNYLTNMNNWLDYSHNNSINYILGIDVGDGSDGFAIIKTDTNANPMKIKKAFSLTFNKGTVPKNGIPLNQKRRGYRHVARELNRTKNRKQWLNELFINNKILSSNLFNKYNRVTQNTKMNKALKRIGSNNGIYKLRAIGLQHKLSPVQIYAILYFFAGHRGFKQIKVNNSLKGKVLKSLHKTNQSLQNSKYKTLGEMLYKDKKFNSQKHNKGRDNGYLFYAKRNQVIFEIKLILKQQKKYYEFITNSFIKKVITVICHQRTFDTGTGKNSKYAGGIKDKINLDSLKLELNDKPNYVLAKSTATYEYFRALQQLNNLTYKFKGYTHKLTEKQKNTVLNKRFSRKSITYKNLNRIIGLTPDSYNLQLGKERTFINFPASYQIAKILPKNKRNSKNIDLIGTILSLYSTPSLIKDKLLSYNYNSSLVNKIINLASKHSFSGFGSLSKYTILKLLPYMRNGLDVTDSLYKSGLASKDVKKTKYNIKHLLLIRKQHHNSVFQRSVHIIFSTLNTIIHTYGRPLAIVVESGREMKKPLRIRAKMQKYQLLNQQRKQKISHWLKLHHHLVNDKNILKFEKYKQQNGLDLIKNVKLNLSKIFDGNNYAQIDHIQPRGISYNNSFNNLELILTSTNVEKGNRTPLQYLGKKTSKGKQFIKNVNKIIKNIGMRKNMLRVVPYKASQMFQPRDLTNNDNIAIFMYNFLRKHMYYKKYQNNKKKQHTFLSTGKATATLRHDWRITKIRSKSDKHHAIDAIIIALSTPKMQYRIKNYYQNPNSNAEFPLPYPDFKNDLKRIWNKIGVKRLDKKNKDAQISKDTKLSGKYLKDGLVMIKKPITALKFKTNKKHPEISFNGSWKYNSSLYKNNPAITKNLKHYLKQSASYKKSHQYILDNSGHKVYKVKLFKPFKSEVISKDGNSIYANAGISDIRVYSYKDKHHRKSYCYVLDYEKDARTNKKKSTLIAKGGSHPKHINKSYHYEFSLSNFSPIFIKFNSNASNKYGSKQNMNVSKNEYQNNKKLKQYMHKVMKIKGKTNIFKIDNKIVGGFPYVQYIKTNGLIPKVKKQNKKFIGRKIKSNEFIGYMRRATSSGSILIQPFDTTSNVNMCKSISMSSLLEIRKLRPLNFENTKFSTK